MAASYATQSKSGDDDGAKRAWARAATQRVLDLMLVTERVQQEEQKRRVAAARASTQVTHKTGGYSMLSKVTENFQQNLVKPSVLGS